MRWIHGRAGWALAAAGSLALALAALGQHLPPTTSKEPADRAQAPAPVPDSEGRAAEIKVELAWLADPATFPCQLAARKVGSTLEVGGFVPHQGLRPLALGLARTHCSMPIVDKIVVHPGSALPVVPARHDQLCKSAAELLSKSLANQTEVFDFTVDTRGQITISGTIGCWEDKLNISRRLSQLPGCTAVTNNCEVRVQMDNGQPCQLVSIDGKCKVPAPPGAMLSAPRPAVARADAAPPQMLPATVMDPVPPGVTIVEENPQPTSKPGLLARTFGRRMESAPVMTPAPGMTQAPVATPKTPTPAILPASATTAVPALVPPSAADPVPTYYTVIDETAKTTPVASSNRPGFLARTFGRRTGTGEQPQEHPTLPTATEPMMKTVPAEQAMKTVAGETVMKPSPAVQQVIETVGSGAVPSRAVQAVAELPARLPAIGSAAAIKVQELASPYAVRLPPGQSGVVSRLAQGSKTAAVNSIQPVAYQAAPAGNQTPMVVPASSRTASPYQPRTAPRPQPETAPAMKTPTKLPAGISARPMPVPAPTTPRTVTAPAKSTPALAPVEVARHVPALKPAPVSTPALQSGTVAAPQLPASPAAAVQPAKTASVLPTAAAAGNRMNVQTHSLLLKRIEEIGKGKIRDIRIQSQSNNECRIEFKVRNKADGQELGPRIIDMPELAAYQVILDIQVQP